MRIVKIHSVILKLRSIVVFFYISFVFGLQYYFILPYAFPPQYIGVFIEIGLTPMAMTYGLFMWMLSGMIAAASVFFSWYVIQLNRSARTPWKHIIPAFILLDAFLSFAFSRKSILTVFEFFSLEEIDLSRLINPLSIFLNVYFAIALVSDVIWLFVNYQAWKKAIPPQVKADGESKSRFFTEILAVFVVFAALIPAFLFASYVLYRFFPPEKITFVQINKINLIFIVAMALLLLQTVTFSASILSHKRKICCLFAVLNIIFAAILTVIFSLECSQLILHNVMIILGEAALIVFSVLTILNYKKSVRLGAAPPAGNNAYLSVESARRNVNVR